MRIGLITRSRHRPRSRRQRKSAPIRTSSSPASASARRPTCSIRSGQDWGLTSFSPQALVAGGFAPFIATLRANLRHAGGVRIDHAMGLMRLWLVPHGAPAVGGRLPLLSARRSAAAAGARIASPPRHRDRRGSRHRAAGLPRALPRRRHRRHGRAVVPARATSASCAPGEWRAEAVGMTTTHDLPTVAGWWRGADLELRRGLGTRRASPRSRERARERTALWQAFTDAGVVNGRRRSRRHRSGRRCRRRVRRPGAGAAGDRAARGHHRRRRAAQPAGHDRPASQLAPPLPPARRTRCCASPRPRTRGLRRLNAQTRRHDAARDAAAAVPQGLHLRRRRGAGALLRRARRQPPLRLADHHGARGLDARLRRHRSDARQSRSWAARTALKRLVDALRREELGPDRRHRAQPHGGHARERMVGRRAAHGRGSRYARYFDIDWEARTLLTARSSCPGWPSRAGRGTARNEIDALGTADSPAPIGSAGGAPPAIASTGGASSTSTSSSACAWRTTRRSRPCMR